MSNNLILPTNEEVGIFINKKLPDVESESGFATVDEIEEMAPILREFIEKYIRLNLLQVSDKSIDQHTEKADSQTVQRP